MRQLIAALANLAVLVEQAIHGANRAVILAFIEQRRINSGCGAILETFFVQTSQDRFSFCPIKGPRRRRPRGRRYGWGRSLTALDRKSTRLNSSHVSISYAVFCLK